MYSKHISCKLCTKYLFPSPQNTETLREIQIPKTILIKKLLLHVLLYSIDSGFYFCIHSAIIIVLSAQLLSVVSLQSVIGYIEETYYYCCCLWKLTTVLLIYFFIRSFVPSFVYPLSIIIKLYTQQQQRQQPPSLSK